MDIDAREWGGGYNTSCASNSVSPLVLSVVYHQERPVSVAGYRQISNIRRIKSQNLKVSRFVPQLSLRNLLKPDVKSRMKM